MMQRHLIKWIGYGLCLLSLVFAGACKRKKINTGNTPGSVLVMQPATQEGRIVRKKLKLKLKLFDPEMIAHLRIMFQGKQLFEKNFPPNKYTEHMMETTLDFSLVPGLKEGRSKLNFYLRDQEGGTTRDRFGILLDRTGPSVIWDNPTAGSTLTNVTVAKLRVNDLSGVDTVKVLYENKVFKTFTDEGPYQFALDPTEYPTGNVTFWVQAKDKLGNQTVKSASFMVLGAALGTPCSSTESCKGSNVCAKIKGASKGFCRKPCRYNANCPAGFTCQRVQRIKLCMPPIYRTRKGRYLAGLFGKCDQKRLCGPGLVCIYFPGTGGSCRIRCGPGKRRCQTGFVCRKVQWTDNKRKVHVCLRPLRRRGRQLQKVGQRCSKRRPCVKTAMCVKAGNKPAMCYKICRSRYNCPGGVQCNSVPGRSQKICVNLPRQKPPSGPYQLCSRKQACRSGLICMSSRQNPKPRCFPKCGSSYCAGESKCMPIGSSSLCMQKCIPNAPNCPSGTGCRMIMVAGKGGYFCN